MAEVSGGTTPTSPTYRTPDTDAFTIACTSDDFVFAFRVAFFYKFHVGLVSQYR